MDVPHMFALLCLVAALAVILGAWVLIIGAAKDKLEARVSVLTAALRDAEERAGHFEHRGNALEKHNIKLYERASLAFAERDNAVGELEAQRLWNMGPASLRPNKRTN